ncbi:MAG TPA: DUF397 domain-containing protein [Actinophytocola sp.]|jgi:hypothetical protein|uniref:DUF397 domain-containing protein n=1 Tax=Actinophytocola sp. TaxID=1872138 RepID=UPI002E012651|nr:DUF397 domain-containing protein [Actinophytocola sp.]
MRTYDSRTAASVFGSGGWFKATASEANGTGCVEVNFSSDGLVGLRDSKHPQGGAFAFTPTEWRTFLTTVSR